MEILKQRAEDDCAICCIAMALNRPYEDVMIAALESGAYKPGEGTYRPDEILRSLGEWSAIDEPFGTFIYRFKDRCLSTEFFRTLAWGRRALMSVSSLNFPDKYHMIYWDGSTIYDPSNLKIYASFEELHPRSLILFREAGDPGDRLTNDEDGGNYAS